MSLPPLLVPGRSAEKFSNGKTCPGTSNGGRPRGAWDGCERAGYETYGFKKAKDREAYSFAEVIEGILRDSPDYIGSEFYLGGQLVKEFGRGDAQHKNSSRGTRPRRLAGADVTSFPFEELRYVGRLGLFRNGAVADTPSLFAKLGIAKKQPQVPGTNPGTKGVRFVETDFVSDDVAANGNRRGSHRRCRLACRT